MCERCWETAHYKCPWPKEMHPRSHGLCEDCHKTRDCLDCPTAHVRHLIRADMVKETNE